MSPGTGARRRTAVIRLAFLFFGMAVCAHAAEPKRIVLLHSFGQNTAPYDTVLSAFRAEVLHAWPGQAAFYDFPLEARLPGLAQNATATVDVIRSRFASVRPDLVVTIGAAAARFYVAHRDELFGGVPLLTLAIDQRLVPMGQLRHGDSVVGATLSPTEMVGAIIHLLPATTDIAVVLGDSPGERFWAEECRKEFAVFGQSVSFHWLNDLTLPQMRDRVAGMRPGTVVLFGTLQVDAAGIPYEEAFALSELHAAASVPIFGFFAGELGQGIVGGPLFSNEEEGLAGARVANRMLRGESAGSDISSEFILPGTPVFDWRELKRWDIADDRLPPDSKVLFRSPSVWEEHKGIVLGSVAVVLVQAALIVALLVQLGLRRRAEGESMALSGRLLTAHEDERRRLARELHDDVTQRLARLAIDVAQLETGKARTQESSPLSVHGELVRLSEDVHALSYRLHPSILDDLGLVEALRAECEQVSRHEPVRVQVELQPVPELLSHEVALCIFRVAQEALRNVARHAEAKFAMVTMAIDGDGVSLSVKDDGVGFDVETVQSRASLGCASMTERVRLLGGKLGIRSALGQGTTVSAWVPLGAVSP